MMIGDMANYPGFLKGAEKQSSGFSNTSNRQKQN